MSGSLRQFLELLKHKVKYYKEAAMLFGVFFSEILFIHYVPAGDINKTEAFLLLISGEEMLR